MTKQRHRYFLYFPELEKYVRITPEQWDLLHNRYEFAIQSESCDHTLMWVDHFIRAKLREEPA